MFDNKVRVEVEKLRLQLILIQKPEVSENVWKREEVVCRFFVEYSNESWYDLSE